MIATPEPRRAPRRRARQCGARLVAGLCLVLALGGCARGGEEPSAVGPSGAAKRVPAEAKGYRYPKPRLSLEEAAAQRTAILAAKTGYVTVGEEGEYQSLRAALAAPEDGRRIFVLLDPVHREAGIRIEKTLSIIGFGAEVSVLEGAARPEAADRGVLSIARGASVYLAGLTIRGGRVGETPRRGGGIANSGTCTIEDCAIVENLATYGVGVYTEGPLTMRRCVIADNRGLRRPPADQLAGVDCGGGGAGLRVDKDGDALLEDCLLAYNEAPSAGGALHVSCEGRARLVACTVFGNKAAKRGGGIDVAGGELLLEACLVAENEAGGQGQAIFNRGRLSVEDTVLAGTTKGKSYVLGTDGLGEFGKGSVERSADNFCESGDLSGSSSGEAVVLPLADRGGRTWTSFPSGASAQAAKKVARKAGFSP